MAATTLEPDALAGSPRRWEFLNEAGDLVHFSARAMRSLPRSVLYMSEALRVHSIVSRRTTGLLFVMCGFLGLSVASFAFFFLRSIGGSDFVGILPGLVTPRQIAPQMFGYVFAGTVACAIAAEIASARIQQELEAYESEGVDPMEILVGTRILAVLLYVPLATATAMAGCLAGSWFIVVVVLEGNTSAQFIETYFSIFAMRGIPYCAITIALVTLQSVLVGCFYGMRDTGAGPDAVGGAVARSLWVNLILLHIVVSLAALAFYGGSLGIPIGE